MGRWMIALDPRVRSDPAEPVAWGAGKGAQTAGPASVEGSARGEFIPDGLTLVAMSAAVNLASTAITAWVSRVAARRRESGPVRPGVGVTRTASADGDHAALVRLRWARS